MAHADAEALARALGGSLGPVISATTTADSRRYEMQMTRSVSGVSGGGPMPIVPSEILIIAGTQVRWQFIAAK
jgi:uncharacterized protein YggE